MNLSINWRSFTLAAGEIIRKHKEQLLGCDFKISMDNSLIKVLADINVSLLERTISSTVEQTRTYLTLQKALQENDRLAAAIANIATGVVITAPNLPGNPIISVNPAFLAITGYSESDMIGKNCRFLQGVDTDAASVAAIREAIATRQAITCTLLNYRKDGTPFWNELTISPVFDTHGKLIHFIGLQTDVTERKHHEAALQESEERYALAVQGANDGIWDWNLKTNQVYFSARWKAMLGYGDMDIDQTLDEWFDRIHPDDLDWFKSRISAHLEGLTSHFEYEHRMRHSSGQYQWVLTRGLAVPDSNGQTSRMAGSQTDITARKLAEEQRLHDALYDALTGLANRTLLLERLRYAVQLTRYHASYRFAVLFLDVDRFKMVNDSLGHRAGDCLLVEIAQRLVTCSHAEDTVARLGGDEFVVLINNITNPTIVTEYADRIQQILQQPFYIDGHEIFTTVSIGITFSEIGYEWSDDLLRDADTAMYWAKAQGKACHAIFNADMHARAVALLKLETDLRRAIERQEFKLYYQPIVSLKTGYMSGFEALLRWHHPDRGLVSPTEFIPIAEETGLIVPVGVWVLHEACRQMREWQLRFPCVPPLTISVNLSGKQFNPDLITHIHHALQESELEAQCLRLEITESILIDNTESAAMLLAQLQGLGIQLSMDDFGTGYSSLSYLYRFPVNTLKIDRSFINKIDRDGEQLAIVRTIMTLAWNLGMDVVAEGIETFKQLAQMRALQCDYGQGYFFSPPLDSRSAEQMITSHPNWFEQKRFA